MYRILQAAFGESCMNQASVFERHKRFKVGRSLWGMMRGVGGVRKSIYQSWLAKRLGLGLLCWDFKGVQEEIASEKGQHSSNRVSGISIRTMLQSTTPYLSQTIWPRWASRQFLTLPVIQTLLPVTFSYSLSSEAVVMRQWGDERGCDEGHWHAHTRGLPWRTCWNGTTSALQPEEITSKATWVSCVYYQ